MAKRTKTRPHARPQSAGHIQDKPTPAPATGPGGQVRTVSVRGISVTIDPTALDDFELLDDVARIEAGQVHRLPSALRRALGTEQAQAVVEQLRDDTGRIPGSLAGKFFFEVLRELRPKA